MKRRQTLRDLFEENELPWYLQPQQQRRLPFMSNDPAIAARLAAADALANEGGEADEDKYAEAADVAVPEWGKDERNAKQKIKSYMKQILTNPENFAFDYEDEPTERNITTPMMIFNLSPRATQGAEKDSDIRRYYSPEIPPRAIKIFKTATRCTLQPLEWKNGGWEITKDEFDYHFPPGFKWVGIPIKYMTDFEKKTYKMKKTTQQFTYDGCEIFLVRENKHPQTFFNPMESAKAYGKIKRKKR